MLRALVVIAALCGTARAGRFCTSNEPAYTVWALERFARDAKQERGAELAAYCLHDQVELKARILAACKRVLDRDPDWASCYVLAAAMGAGTLGKHDVFAWVAARPRKPGDVDFDLPSDPLALFAALADARAAPLVIATWRAADIEATRHGGERAWLRELATWRKHAAATLGAVGDKDTIEFLRACARDIGDRGVASACREAIDAIGGRV